MGQTAESHQWR